MKAAAQVLGARQQSGRIAGIRRGRGRFVAWNRCGVHACYLAQFNPAHNSVALFSNATPVNNADALQS
jgi:hypothetical protein